jgi:hypothetical protein
MPPLPVPPRRPTPPETPEALYDTLQGTDAGVRHLWAHQADALRIYYDEHRESADVALEFPTGAGKTLVGTLIAEWRRQMFKERVAFLCPNNQLANQAARKAESYGIDVVLLVGSHRDWAAEDIAAFEAGNAIAVTNYHHIFNSDPKIGAQTLVLDDAHAGEPVVAGRWTVTADRSTALYEALKVAVEDVLPEHVVQVIREDSVDPRARQDVELVAPTAVAHRYDEIARAIDENVAPGSPASYSWSSVRSGLASCLMYVSWSGISLRPLIAPTMTLPEFADAQQRVYMSATLGLAGELERSFGVTKIERIPLPRGWERQGSGRRLPQFPALGDDDVQTTIRSALQTAGHSLVIAPSERRAESAIEQFVPPDMPVLTKDHVRVDFDAFTEQDSAVLVLANRYDGMDLPDDACRLILLYGLPLGVHHQERFLFETLGAREALEERIRTRITQGMGRATRNRQDYAVVLFAERELLSFISREDVRRSIRPELQAELALGLHYADEGVSIREAMDTFFEQGDAWQPSEAHLRETAEELVAHPMPGADALSSSAPHEIRAWAHAWRGDYAGARDHGRKATRALTGEAVKQYRALWHYLVSAWAQLVSDETSDHRDAQIAAELRRDAENAFSALRWFPRFEDQVEAPLAGPEYSWRLDRAADWVDRNRRGPRLQKALELLTERIGSDDYREFELGLETLGEILGFESVRPNETADPDCAWREGSEVWILWEAKTMEHGDAPLAARDARQAGTHHNWVKRQLGWPEPDQSVTVVVCARDEIHPDAAAVADERLVLVSPSVVREIAGRAVQAIASGGNDAPVLDPEQLRDRIGQLFVQHRLGTGELLQEVTGLPVASRGE